MVLDRWKQTLCLVVRYTLHIAAVLDLTFVRQQDLCTKCAFFFYFICFGTSANLDLWNAVLIVIFGILAYDPKVLSLGFWFGLESLSNLCLPGPKSTFTQFPIM